MNTDGSGLHNIISVSAETGVYGDPSWAPDGTNRIAYTYTPLQSGEHSHIWVINSDGTGNTQLTNAALDDFSPVWSPAGTRIAFSRASTVPGGQPDIFVMNEDGSNVVQLTTAGADQFPTWSPDGARIAFIRAGQIFIMNADGFNQHNISGSNNTDNYPSW